MLDVRKLAAIKPVIVDEALASLEDLELALELGYSGAALKSCKCQSEELVIAARLTEHGELAQPKVIREVDHVLGPIGERSVGLHVRPAVSGSIGQDQA